MRIEKLCAEQWRRYRAIRLRALADAPDAFARSLSEEETFLEEDWRKRLSSRGNTFIANIDGQDIGVATGAACKGRAESAGLYGMWVAPEGRRQGIGLSLVMAVIKWARSTGYDQLVLDVSENNSPAIKLYKKAGFKPLGEPSILHPDCEHIMKLSCQFHSRRPTK